MAKVFLLCLSLLCYFSSSPVKASTECTVEGKVISKATKAPCPFITLFVKQGGQVINYNYCKTDKKGNFVLEFNVGSWGDTSMASDKRAWLNFYAVKKAGDTILLHSGFMFPGSFTKVDAQEYKTVFYLK